MTGGAPDEPLRLRPGAVEWTREDGETIGLDLSQAQFVGLNRSASMLWQALADGTTRGALVERLATEYGLSAERAESDVTAFVDACRARGYLLR